MVSHTNALGTEIASELLKIGITQLTCGHLYTHAMKPGKGTRIKMSKV